MTPPNTPAVGGVEASPCPFCGGKPRFEHGKLGHCSLHGEPFQSVRLYCYHANCDVKPSVSAGDIYNGGWDKAKADAVAKWNRRTPPQSEKLREALEAARWRALMTMPRIRMWGSAGVDPKTGERREGTYVHFGAEFWTEVPRDYDADADKQNNVEWGRHALTAAADALIARQALSEG